MHSNLSHELCIDWQLHMFVGLHFKQCCFKMFNSTSVYVYNYYMFNFLHKIDEGSSFNMTFWGSCNFGLWSLRLLKGSGEVLSPIVQPATRGWARCLGSPRVIHLYIQPMISTDQGTSLTVNAPICSAARLSLCSLCPAHPLHQILAAQTALNTAE